MSDEKSEVREIVLALIQAGVLKLEEIDLETVQNSPREELIEQVTARVRLVQNLIEAVAPRA
jgi:hypothetical protein